MSISLHFFILLFATTEVARKIPCRNQETTKFSDIIISLTRNMYYLRNLLTEIK